MAATLPRASARLFRSIGYLWAAPLSVFGLPLLLLALRRGDIRLVEGVIEAHSPALAHALTHWVPIRGGYAAMTIGHIVVGRNAHCLAANRAHEHAHVRQGEWLGPLFPPAYILAAIWARLQGGCGYADNWFEKRARDAEDLARLRN